MSEAEITLWHYPLEAVRLACVSCDQNAEQSRAALISHHGGAVPLGEMLSRLVEQCCPNAGQERRCELYFPDLVPLPPAR